MIKRSDIRQEIGRTDVPVRIARTIVQVQVIRPNMQTVVTVTADKGRRAETPPTPHPISHILNFIKNRPPVGGELRRRSPSVPPPCCYAAIGCSKKTDAPKLQLAEPAPLAKAKQSAPTSRPLPQLPPTRATHTAALLNHNPSHWYVVLLPLATYGIRPYLQDFDLLIYPPDVPDGVNPVSMNPSPVKL